MNDPSLAARDAEMQTLRTELRERFADLDRTDAQARQEGVSQAVADAVYSRAKARVLDVARRIAELP